METNNSQNVREGLDKASKVVLMLAIAGMVANFFALLPVVGFIAQMCNIFIIACIVSFSIKLDNASALLDEADAAAIKKIRIGIQLFVLAFILKEIPAAGGILGMISFVISYIFMMLGFNYLKNSETFPCKNGMSLISIAMILGIIGSVLTIIPIIGIVGKLTLIASFLLLLLGWKKVVAVAAIENVADAQIDEASEASKAEEPETPAAE